jgi:hypothetical protein
MGDVCMRLLLTSSTNLVARAIFHIHASAFSTSRACTCFHRRVLGALNIGAFANSRTCVQLRVFRCMESHIQLRLSRGGNQILLAMVCVCVL